MQPRSNEDKPALTLSDLVESVRRRWRLLFGLLCAGLVLTLCLTLFIPPTYRSTGTILIEQQEVPTDLVRSTVTSYADQRVQVISQRVMTTQNLLEIVRRHDLYPAMIKRESRERIIEAMRDDIRFEMLSADVIDPRSGMPRKATIAFTVSYEHRSPDLAMKVANELTTLYLNENLTSRARLAQDTAVFLTEEGDRLQKQITALEGKLAAFKQKNVEQLPELAQLNMQLLDRTEQELRDAETEMRALAQQRVFLEAQLVQIKPNSMYLSDTGERIMSPADRLKTLRSELAGARARYAPDHPDIPRLEREVAGLQGDADAGGQTDRNDVLRQLEQARGELALARQSYAPEHPDVRRLERSVEQLERELAVIPSSRAAPMSEGADNPAYIQLRAQLEASINNQGALQGKIAALKAKAIDYQRKISVVPSIEQQYRELSRDYESAQLRYREVRAKQMEAQLAENLETDRKGERFSLIEPPLSPEEPASPNRLAILVLGFILSVAFAGGAVAMAEALDSSIRGRRDVLEILKSPPLALIPRIITGEEIRAATRRLRLAAAGSVAAGFSALTLVHFLYRPLDTLWFVFMRRLGM
jgi:polysaccharide biosynthesis transport protein